MDCRCLFFFLFIHIFMLIGQSALSAEFEENSECSLHAALLDVVKSDGDKKKLAIERLEGLVREGHHPDERLPCFSGSLYGFALISGDEDLVRFMIRNGANPRELKSDATKIGVPLIGVIASFRKGIKYGNPENVIRLLVEEGADPDVEIKQKLAGKLECTSARRLLIQKIHLYKEMCLKDCFECCSVVASMTRSLGYLLEISKDTVSIECGQSLKNFAAQLGDPDFLNRYLAK